jgi:hypothetical protein
VRFGKQAEQIRGESERKRAGLQAKSACLSGQVGHTHTWRVTWARLTARRLLLEGAECTGIENWIENDVLCEAHVKLVVSSTGKVLEVGLLPRASKSTDDDSSTTRRSAGNAAGISPMKRRESSGATSPTRREQAKAKGWTLAGAEEPYDMYTQESEIN